MRRIRVGQWRDDANGADGSPSQARSAANVSTTRRSTPAERLGDEISRFLEWFEDTRSMEPVLAAGVAHLWFVTIHPFEDGNGRIARAIADMALARSEESPERFYSMSAEICLERKRLLRHPRDNPETRSLDITDWQVWLLECPRAARSKTLSSTLATVLTKASLLGGLTLPPVAERATGECPQPASRRFRREAFTSSKWASDEPLFPGHGQSRH